MQALLERVLSDADDSSTPGGWDGSASSSLDRHEVEPYIEAVAESWRESEVDFAQLWNDHNGNRFGCSALGRYVLLRDTLSGEWAPRIASQLTDLGEYSLSAEIYRRLHEAGLADYAQLIRYANAHSESHPTIKGANEALAIVDEAVAKVEHLFRGQRDSPEAIDALAYCKRRRAGLVQWRWHMQMEETDEDPAAAIAAQSELVELLEQSRRLGTPYSSSAAGPLAQARLKRLLLMRIQATDPHDDLRGILQTKELPDDDRKSTSYLRWYRTIALADSGAENRVRQSALEAFAKDADLMHAGPEYAEIGRRQYVQLRRFLEQYSKWLRHPELVGVVGQTLQARR